MKRSIILAMAVAIAMICTSAYADLNKGLVAAYAFEDGAMDQTGRNNGIIHGASSAAGMHGKCLDFDGTDDYVEIPDNPSLHLPEGLTVAAWINIDAAADHAGVCAKHIKIGWGANFSWRIAVTNDTSITWGRCVEGGEEYFATGGVLPGAGEWIHVAMTCMAPDAATNQRAFVNGEDITDVTGQADNLTAEPPFLVFEGIPVEIGVGRARGGTEGNDMFFDGMIDDVVIYNRGLTAAEIGDLMDMNVLTAVEPTSKLIGTWASIKSK